MIDSDRRTDAEKDREAFPLFVSMTDKFMSGWGQAPGRSLYSLAVRSVEEAERVIDNAGRRSEMRYVRVSSALPRKRPGDHLSVAGPTHAARWYEQGAWSK